MRGKGGEVTPGKAIENTGQVEGKDTQMNDYMNSRSGLVLVMVALARSAVGGTVR